MSTSSMNGKYRGLSSESPFGFVGRGRGQSAHVIWVLAILGLIGSPLNPQGASAQGAASATPVAGMTAAEMLTADEMMRYLRVLTSDSLQGRDTPSPSLDRMAAYLVGEFKRVAAAARDTASASRDTAWIQRYTIPGYGDLDWSRTKIFFLAPFARRGTAVVSERGDTLYANAAITFATAARPAIDLVELNWPKRSGGFPHPPAVQLVAGQHTPESVQHAGLRASHVIYVPPAGLDSARERQIVDALLAASRGVLVIADDDSLTFARRLAAARQHPFRLVDFYMSGRTGVSSWGAYAWLPAVRDVLLAADVDVVALRQAATPVVKALPDFVMDLSPEGDTTRGPAPTAPNVIAVLEGSDPTLKAEYVAFTAHLDTDGEGHGDNAAGLAGLLALAKAFSAPGARPKRSVVLVATSGATKDWWGARSFATRYGPTAGIASHLVASLHLDALDQIRGDSLAVDGLRDFATASSPASVGAAYPELGVTLVDGGPVDRSPSNLGAYLVRARPSLAFHAPGDSAAPARPRSAAAPEAPMSRVLRLIFYMGYNLADAGSPIGWSPEGRSRLQRALDGE